MSVVQNERWRCANPACWREVVLPASSNRAKGDMPRCSCGYSMRRFYTPPRLRPITESGEVRSLQEKFASGVR